MLLLLFPGPVVGGVPAITVAFTTYARTQTFTTWTVGPFPFRTAAGS